MRGHDDLAIVGISIRRISFKNSIWREGDSANSGSSKMKMPWRWQRSSKKRRNPSPCECERKSARSAPSSQADLVEISRDGKEAFGAEEPAVGDLRQPARAQRLRKLPAHRLERIGMIDRPIALATAGFVISGKHGDAFQKGGFAGAVFADDDGDGAVEAQFEIVRRNGRQNG